jgi:hypothetical protein
MEHGIKVGDPIKGFCGGYFGRDSYDNRVVEAVGPDWVVTRNVHGKVEMYHGDDMMEFAAYIKKSNKDII